MNTDEKRAALHAAYNHNSDARLMASCNHPYMGSMATYNLIGILGGDGARDGIAATIDMANDQQLDAGIAYCRKHGYIRINFSREDVDALIARNMEPVDLKDVVIHSSNDPESK